MRNMPTLCYFSKFTFESHNVISGKGETYKI